MQCISRMFSACYLLTCDRHSRRQGQSR